MSAIVIPVLLAMGLAGTASAQLVGTGTHPWVVVLCKGSNEPVDPGGSGSAAFYQQMYTNAGAGSGQFNFVDYWHDVSFGQLSVAGTTIASGSHADANGWYTMAQTRDTWGYTRGRFDKVIDCANAAILDVNFHNYWGVIAVFPEAQGRTTTALDTTATTVTLNVSATSPPQTVTTTNYFPTPPFKMEVTDCNGAGAETVNVTSISGNQFTISRGANGTTAVAHATSACVGVPGDFGGATNTSPVGTPPGQSNVTLADSNVYQLATVILPNETNLTGLQHETGHGFGYDHTRKLSYSTTDYQDATDDMSAYSGTYEFTTLGTPFGGSVLGSLPNDKGPGLDAINLDLQGWIPGGRQYNFNNSVPNQSTITLHALSDPNALTAAGYLEARSPAAVTIENASPSTPTGPTPPTNPPTCSGSGFSCTTSVYYTLEYRQKTGWDSGFPASAVVLHLLGSDGRSYWVDQTPSGNGLLVAGDEYVDAANNTYVAVNTISGSNAQVSLGSAKINPQLVYSGDTSGTFHDPATLAADLTVAGSTAPVPNAPVTLSLGTQSCGATTDAAGHAACGITITQPGGGYTAGAAYAGDAAYNPTSGSAGFTVNREDTATTYTGPTLIAQGPVTFSAHLVEDATTPVAGRTLTVTIGSGGGSQSCVTGPTDASGDAQCSMVVTVNQGPQPVSASFAGDGSYLPSSDASHTAFVFSQIVTGSIPGTIIVPAGQSYLISGATVGGGVVADRAAALFICGSNVHGSVSAARTTGFVLIGDAAADDALSCRANTLGGAVHLSANSGGIELGGNHISGSVVVNGNTGNPPGSIADPGLEIEGNTVTPGGLSCTGNAPAPINDAHPNVIGGAKSGQCAGL